ncbi:MAG: peptidase C45 acyl-coenzyme A:6-aminopenicillanic acid acyl-transferase [Planctomycetaceae bacterium]|nr:peptidase C45 acyl-coenzyme A:6-aminopenicillanic acid acyl-transferase [Planctomycetaceae bacterium]
MLPRPIWFLVLLLLFPSATCAEELVDERLKATLQPLLQLVREEQQPCSLHCEMKVPIDGRPQWITVDIRRYDGESFDFRADHEDYAVEICRRAEESAVILPKHGIAYLATGDVHAKDNLAPTGFLSRAISEQTSLQIHLPIAQFADREVLVAMIKALPGFQFDANDNSLKIGDALVRLRENEGILKIVADDVEVTLDEGFIGQAMPLPDLLKERGVAVSTEVGREEMERQLARGLRRTLAILRPSRVLTNPEEQSRRVEHGEIRWVDGHRIALLNGSPEQLGTAHGQLLREEAIHCIDSVLYAFGTVQTVRTGRWFRLELEDAYARLSPHIPERHKIETRALAKAIDLNPDLVETLNVFPELFHCSGFAVFGKATEDGTLYHGRVLDYMTAIGLQDAATTFIVAPDDHHAFANVGYAGFIGSVTGMNDVAVSLGEMGGRGEGQWDGVPMATLMRRALEECSTLAEVKSLWADSPRTCEYYYVFADGKTNEAVGVAATPDKIEFVGPGEGHELLGDGIEDAVVLSAGSRLETLRARVQEKHGKIDEETAIWLMSRPVAMQSNLHNALFVPAKGILYVANASHSRPAAERPYIRLNLQELLRSMESPANQAAMR